LFTFIKHNYIRGHIELALKRLGSKERYTLVKVSMAKTIVSSRMGRFKGRKNCYPHQWTVEPRLNSRIQT
jgi:hypothetical protein